MQYWMSSLLCLAVVFSVVTCTELKLMTLSKPEKIRKAIELLNSLGSDDEPQPSQAILLYCILKSYIAIAILLASNTLSPSWQRQSCTRELSSSSRPGNSSRGNEGMY